MQGAPITKPDGPWVHRDQLVCGAAAAVGMVLANYLDDRPFVLGPPLLLLAVRFFELARFRLVHRSGWLLVASLSWLLLATIVMIVNAIARDDPVGNVVWGCIFFALVWLCLRFAARVRAA
jgi:hypothetical protein